MEDLRLSKKPYVPRDREYQLRPTTSILQSITLSKGFEVVPFSRWKWAELAIACPKLSSLGIELTPIASLDVYEADWLGSIFRRFPDLRTLLLFVCTAKARPRRSSCSGWRSLLLPGSEPEEACEILDFIQEHKAGCPLRNLTVIYGSYKAIDKYSEYDKRPERFGFPGIHYAVCEYGALKVTKYEEDGHAEIRSSVKYGVWKPKPRPMSEGHEQEDPLRNNV